MVYVWGLLATVSSYALVSHSCPFAFADGEPDPRTSTLDHIAVSVEDYDVEAAKEYLTSRGAEIITFGSRFGADGHGFSLYTRDPEGNVVELKLGWEMLDGTLPSELGALGALQIVELHDNRIKGTVPTQIGRQRDAQHMGRGGYKSPASTPGPVVVQSAKALVPGK